MSNQFKAGAAEVSISPKDSQFLIGYPHVERWSTGIHDPLLSSSLFLDDGNTKVLFIANDIIYLNKSQVSHIRSEITRRTDIPQQNIMITATHTHSGPGTVRPVGWTEESVVPEPDEAYLDFLLQQICDGACRAAEAAVPAEIGLTEADNTGIGTNRRDPEGPRNPVVPVLSVRNRETQKPIALMLACSMHPTVLHEDSTLVSADFPGAARDYLKQHWADCPVVYHTSPAGNQSPRHVTRENTFAEAKRIGEILGRQVELVLPSTAYRTSIELHARQKLVPLVINPIPETPLAVKQEQEARERWQSMKARGDSPKHTRTAECDWFGAERRLMLAGLRDAGSFEAEVQLRQPAEVQLIAAGPWKFISWPGEIFVEYALEVMEKEPDAYVIAYANGEASGYLVTEEAVKEGGYEAATAMFKSPESPNLLVEASLELCRSIRRT